MTDQNEGGGAADEPLPQFPYYFGYNEYVPVYFKQEMVPAFTGFNTLRPRNTVKVLEDSSCFQEFRKPSGLNIFVEKTYGSNWVQHEFIYER